MNPAGPTTVLLADDHSVVRDGLRAFLATTGYIQVVGEAATGREAVKLAADLRPAVVVMDIGMPDLNGCEATRQILLAAPATKVLVLSAHSDDEYVARAVESGARGFLEKRSSGRILLEAIRAVAGGGAYFSSPVARRLMQNAQSPGALGGVRAPSAPRLSSREVEVLQLVAEGAPNKRIAVELGISIKTVQKHRQQLMNKLGIHDTAGLTRYAIASGTVENDPRSTRI